MDVRQPGFEGAHSAASRPYMAGSGGGAECRHDSGTSSAGMQALDIGFVGLDAMGTPAAEPVHCCCEGSPCLKASIKSGSTSTRRRSWA
jgi:hypothetical protein